MARIIALSGLLFAALAPLSAEACRNIVPDIVALQSYENIFVGEVSGIRLMDYERIRLGRTRGCEIDQSDEGLECIETIDGSPRIKLFVIPTKVIKGMVTDVQELEQAGCTNSDIPLKQQGIFFVYPGTKTAVIVWRFNTLDYASWLERLKVGPGGQ